MRVLEENSGYQRERDVNRSRNAINRYRQSRKRKSNNVLKLIGLILGVLAVIVLVIFGALRFIQYRSEKKEIEGYSIAEMKQDIYLDFSDSMLMQ